MMDILEKFMITVDILDKFTMFKGILDIIAIMSTGPWRKFWQFN